MGGKNYLSSLCYKHFTFYHINKHLNAPSKNISENIERKGEKTGYHKLFDTVEKIVES